MSRFCLLVLLVPLASCTSCGGASPPPRRAEPGPAAQIPETLPSPLPPRPEGPAREWSPLGTNLDGASDWSEAIPFIDAFRLSRAWTSAPGPGAQDDERPIAVDEHGWVTRLLPDQIVRTGIIWDVETARGGRYLVTWIGRGRLDTFGGAAGHVLDRGQQTMVVDWDPARDGAGFGLALLETDVSDPLRDIRVLPPGGACREARTRFCEEDSEGCECLSFVEHHETLVFHPDFLATLGSYQVVRFMNWQQTNNSEEERWSDRPRVEDARWSVHGVPPEVIVDLSNRLGAHPWLCLPHRSDDGYARELGRLVRARLDPALHVRVELSNEVWNNIFTQWRYAADEGLRLELADAGDEGLSQIRWVARRSVEAFAAFDEGFGDRARTIHVLSTHVENPWVAEQMLTFEETPSVVDELGIAPYFGYLLGPDERADVIARGVDGLYERADVAMDEVLGRVREHVTIAQRHDLRVVAYEGGQHMVAVGGLERDDDVVRLLVEANRDPRIGRLYTRYLAGWRDAGGALLVHFVNVGGWGRYGTWGVLEHPRQDVRSAPKYLALETFARRHRPWF